MNLRAKQKPSELARFKDGVHRYLVEVLLMKPEAAARAVAGMEQTAKAQKR